MVSRIQKITNKMFKKVKKAVTKAGKQQRKRATDSPGDTGQPPKAKRGKKS